MRMSKEEVEEFISAIREPIIDPLINDWKSGELGLEEFVAHVFMSGVMFKGMTNPTNKQE